MPAEDGNSRTIPCACCSRSRFKPALDCEGFSFVRCASCGLVQRNPQPLPEEIKERYSKTYGGDYLSYELKNEAAFLKLQQLALTDAGFYKLEKKIFARNAGGALGATSTFDIGGASDAPSALDIGCATGALLDDLRSRGWRVTGVEISPSAKYARDARKLDVRGVPLEEIKFPDKSFDVVLASHLIEHLNDPKAFLLETYRVLKDNGFCFITTPNISGFQARLFGSRWRSAIFDHLYLFSAASLSNMLKNTSFKIESIRTWGGLAAGYAPRLLKKAADFWAKKSGCGDVMIVRAGK